jgi:undecaprenyl diphosphate synthase
MHRIPKHIGLIMDGNGRWATRQGLSRLAGHQAGLHHMRTVLPICFNLGIEIVSGYLWSTENWRRPAAEVAHMRCLLRTFGPDFTRELHAQHVRIIHSGHREGLTDDELAVIDEAVALTRYNGPHTFNIAFNYGGRDELVRAARLIAAQHMAPDAITEETVSAMLFTSLPDLDLVIRTAGERRLSNFLLWQSANAVLYVTDVCWPDVTQREIEEALQFYQQMAGRRHGTQIDPN